MTRSPIHDFDFLFGHWEVEHRRLTSRGVGSDDWDVSHGTAFTEPRMGGITNIEQHDCSERGWRGVALRTLDLTTGEWSIYWISDRDGRLSPPVVGRFHDDGCRLEGPDLDGERPILARFEWSRVNTDTPHWAQHFSYDDGRTWELNWAMKFRRTT
ncbi:DUF1579 domain-containing protein [uncultured Brevundimonas sp.]|jgi:hypothetical protein|uniref:DUF1579 domain-containing protein n=1 Tax=uncultured Brevundimonas sp. TaxID=213418 RepID=UPI0026128D03|nr:DUF1579 domain-containing protein [uncultured Brevundimonas sp.]